MAMLAEKRTKTRYYLHHKTQSSVGNNWCQDSSKFGQRMLEKMGWSAGKGLGLKEDGSTEPVHVSYKWDNKGVGFTATDGAEAVAQQTEFNDLLEQLNAMQGELDTESVRPENNKRVSSLEQKSKVSRARVHYHKFTRGKDLSRASDKDLACILGAVGEKNSSSDDTNTVIPDVGPPIASNLETTFGISIIHRGNANDYFKQKLREKKSKAADFDAFPSNDASTETLSSEIVQGEHIANVESSCIELSNKKGKKRKLGTGESKDQKDQVGPKENRRKSVTWGEVKVSLVSKYINSMQDKSASSESDNSSFEAVTDDQKERKKKSKQNCDDEIYSEGLTNDNHEISCTSLKKRKKKKTEGCERTENSLLMETVEEDVIVISESDNKRRKKNKKQRVKYDPESLAALLTEELETKERGVKSDVCNLNNEHEETASKQKMKKRKGEKNASLVNEAVEPILEAEKVGTKNKKKKNRGDNLHTEQSHASTPNVDNEVQTNKKSEKKRVKSECINNCEEKINEKKKKKELALESLDNLELCEGKNAATEVKSKNSEGKNKNKELSFDFVKGTNGLVVAEGKIKKPPKSKKVDGIALSSDVREGTSELGTEGREAKSQKSKAKKNVDVIFLSDSETGDPPVKKRKQNHKDDGGILIKKEDEKLSQELNTKEKKVELSALTLERMKKWKKGTDKLKIEAKAKSIGTISTSTPTQGYTARRVLSILGVDVKNPANKDRVAKLPPTNFTGSNIDSVIGYAQKIRC